MSSKQRVEYVAVYQGPDGIVRFNLQKDSSGAYRLSCTDGLYPIRHYFGDLEFLRFDLADGSRDKQRETFMHVLLSRPLKRYLPVKPVEDCSCRSAA